MAVTKVTMGNESISGQPQFYLGLFADARPTGVPIGSKFFCYDTGDTEITRDGTNWNDYPTGGGAGGGDATEAKEDTIITNLGSAAAHTLKSANAKIGDIARTLDLLFGARWDSSGDLGTDIAALIAAVGSNLVVTGTFTTSSTTVPADTGRTEASNYWNGCVLIPLTGAVAFQPRIIRSFNNTGGVFTLDAAFTAAPTTVAYAIVPKQDNSDLAAIKAKTDVIPLRVSKLHAAISAATVACFTGTGRIGIVELNATVVNANIANTGCTVKWNAVSDALAGVDLCAASPDIKQMVRGTLISMTGTLADAALAVTGVAVRAAQAGMIKVGGETSFAINAIYSGAPATGQLLHSICWVPLSPGATLVAA